MKLISRARRTPIACGSSTVSPHPGITPTRVWVSPNLARSDATRKSQLSASSKPPVMATPLIAPISGLVSFGNGPRDAGACCGRRRRRCRRRGCRADEPSSLRSRPAQNAGSAPVRMITSTSSGRRRPRCISCGSSAQQLARQRVAGLGPVQRDRGDAVAHVEQDRRSWRPVIGIRRRSASVMPVALGAATVGATLSRRRPSSAGRKAKLQVAEAHERRRDPAAEGAEVLVEQRAGAVGERLLGELVEALVGDLDGVLELARPRRRRVSAGSGWAISTVSPARSRRPSPISGLDVGQRGVHLRRGAAARRGAGCAARSPSRSPAGSRAPRRRTSGGRRSGSTSASRT